MMTRRFSTWMFAFYYHYTSMLNRVFPWITLAGRKLRVSPTVYKPLDDEHRLAEWIEAGKTVLDVGCGSGVLTVFAALKSKHVTAVDINPEAVANTRLNGEALGLANITAQVSDM
jgi:methylase of polypeptide subunit release factors